MRQVGPVMLKRDEAERVAVAAANLTYGTNAGLAQHPALRPAALAHDAAGYDQLIVLSAETLTFADFLPLAVHAAKWTLLGTAAGQPTSPARLELAALVAAEATGNSSTNSPRSIWARTEMAWMICSSTV